MLSDQDIEKLKGVFLTKEEAEKFATKDDLEKFPTKDFVKAEFDAFTARAVQLFATKQDMQELTERFSRVEENVDKILTAVDGIAKNIDNMEVDAMKHQLSQHEHWHHQMADHLNIKLAD